MPFPERSQAPRGGRNGFVHRPFGGQARPQSIKDLIECLISSMANLELMAWISTFSCSGFRIIVIEPPPFLLPNIRT
jgi:hypothetical protein